MDVHPTKNVSIGIDPYPYILMRFSIINHPAIGEAPLMESLASWRCHAEGSPKASPPWSSLHLFSVSECGGKCGDVGWIKF